jgi:hypothetical protein
MSTEPSSGEKALLARIRELEECNIRLGGSGIPKMQDYKYRTVGKTDFDQEYEEITRNTCVSFKEWSEKGYECESFQALLLEAHVSCYRCGKVMEAFDISHYPVEHTSPETQGLKEMKVEIKGYVLWAHLATVRYHDHNMNIMFPPLNPP